MGETVNETVKLILSLSVSGGLFALVLFALKPLMRNRLSKSFQYYIWLVVLLRFILPFSFGINLMDFTFNTPNAPQIVEETVIPNNNPTNSANINTAVDNNAVNNNNPNITEQQPSTPVSTDSAEPFDIIKTLADNLLWIWLVGAIISAAWGILGYLRFIRYVHGVAYAVEMPGDDLRPDCGAKVYKSRFAPTPMLVGVIRPRIYLPDIEYTDIQLNNIMLHELTHLRRCDIWLKWFAALVVSVHWFNPIAYFMRREFNRACELSCDEAVICNLDGTAKQNYGDTLISVVVENRYPVGVMSTTMCEEKKKLKERLMAIMNYKKKTKTAVMITVILAVAIMGGALAFGANATGKTLPEKVLTSTVEDIKSIFDTYYSGQSSPAFEYIQKRRIQEFMTEHFTPADIGTGIVNQRWNYDSFARYDILYSNGVSVSSEDLYYCTFSADNGRCGYIVVSYDEDGPAIQNKGVVETAYLYDLQANMDEIIAKLSETELDLSSTVALRARLGSNEVILFSDNSGKNYIYYFDDASLIIPSIEDAAQTIKLAELRQLASKGNELIFEDFNDYEGQEVGFGLYILHFKIEGGYELFVGGGAVTGKPMYATLNIPGIEESIDIRYEDLDEYIGKYHVPNELRGQIYGYLDTIMTSPSLSSNSADYIKEHQDEYNTILDIGVTALPTLTDILNNGDKGLRGVIAAALVQDIIAVDSGKPHSDWTDGVLQSAASDALRWSRGFPPNDSQTTRDDEPGKITTKPVIISEGISNISIDPTLAPDAEELERVYSSPTSIFAIIEYLTDLTFYDDLPAVPVPENKQVVAYYITINYNDGTITQYIHFGRFFAPIIDGERGEWKQITYEESFKLEDIIRNNPSD